MSKKQPEPDEFGRLRVRDEDTGHEYSVNASALPYGNYVVLDEPASNAAGESLPPKHAAPRSLSSHTTSGQSADVKKENDND